MLGGAGMAVFAVVAMLTLGHLSLARALLLAAAAWLLTALALYAPLWWR